MVKIRKSLITITFVLAFVILILTSLYIYNRPRGDQKKEVGLTSNTKKERYTTSADSKGAIEFEKLISELVPTDGESEYWENWDWRSSLFFANIIDENNIERKMVIKITTPKGQVFSDNEQIVDVRCEPEDVARYSKLSLRFVESNVDIFNYASKGDGLYSYCLNEMCSVIGSSCILIE